MAREYQIDQAFRDLGILYASEHAEHDDEGASQVQEMIRLLRRFKRHEQSETPPAPRLAEATYGEPGTPQVWYDNGRDAIRDATDLYTVLAEEHATGSPNLENTQARTIVEHLQRGGGLGEMQIALLRKLMAKHGTAVAALRSSRDRDGQDILDVPTAGPEARIVDQGEAA